MISSLIFTIALGGAQLDCTLDEGKRTIHFKESGYNKLTELVANCPEIRDPAYRVEFAQAANFLFKGLLYKVVGDTEEFKKSYREEIQSEESSFSSGQRLADFGVFDVERMHAPRIEDDHMIFYVEHGKTAIPYEVSVPLSPSRRAISYRLLPFAKPA